MTTTHIEVTHLEEIVGSHEIACEYNGDLATGGIEDHDDPAKWVMFGKCGDCTHSVIRLACTRCKDARTASSHAIECVDCGEVTVPASHFYSRIEAL